MNDKLYTILESFDANEGGEVFTYLKDLISSFADANGWDKHETREAIREGLLNGYLTIKPAMSFKLSYSLFEAWGEESLNREDQCAGNLESLIDYTAEYQEDTNVWGGLTKHAIADGTLGLETCLVLEYTEKAVDFLKKSYQEAK